MRLLIKSLALIIMLLVLFIALTLGYWLLRPNASITNQVLKIDPVPVVSDGMHNAFTDMIKWKGDYYLIFARSPSHLFSDESRLVLMQSSNMISWEEIHSFSIPGQDIRDPKFAIFDDRLFMYVMKNLDFTAEPYGSAYTFSEDGKNWRDLKDISQKGWLFWRPKTRDGKTWYMPAYWSDHGKSMLLKSTNGIDWEVVSVIYEGDRNDETAITFMPDGSIICTARLEGSDSWFGDPSASTLIATAKYPYKKWTTAKSQVTRLDGPFLFTYRERAYAVGRQHVGCPGFLNDIGSILGRKRTALYLVTNEKLVHLSDLPSAGDTSYASGIMEGDTLGLVYYTSNPRYDYPWILGMLKRSDLLYTTIDLTILEKIAKSKTR